MFKHKKISLAVYIFHALLLFCAGNVFAANNLPDNAPGRPILGKGTVLSERGTLLRGPYWSIDLKGKLPDRASVMEIPDCGMNALHVYAERHDDGVPAGTYKNQIDTLVRWCGEAGIYCVITIGCGNHNGMFDLDFARKFWEIYAPRYRDMTWVIYEIHNEPYSWEPPYDNTTLKMEQEMYNLIRRQAPDTMLLFFSYAGLGAVGLEKRSSVSSIAQDISKLDVDWSNAAVAFHGYGSMNDENLRTLKSLGINSINTEVPIGSRFADEQVNAENIYLCEKNDISWLVFIRIARGYLKGWKFKQEIDDRKLGWKPDFGTWPDRPLDWVPRKNIAEGKPVTVSSIENFRGMDLLGKYATDGDPGTRWGSAFADNQYLIVDLEKPADIKKIIIHWESQYAVGYRIQLSDDMKNWETVITQNHGKGGGSHRIERVIVGRPARYIKLLCLKRRMQYGFSLYEIEVFQ